MNTKNCFLNQTLNVCRKVEHFTMWSSGYRLGFEATTLSMVSQGTETKPSP